MLEKWKFIKSEKIFSTKIFTLLKKHYLKPVDNKDFSAYVLDLPNWVNIVGLNNNDDILLIKQFRFGTDKIELEIPGGLINPGESPKDAAIRELKEETGYNVNEIREIGCVSGNPAFLNNKCYTFMAKLSQKGEVNFDPDEIIECEFATLPQINEYLRNGEISNAYCLIGLMWYIYQFKS